MPGCSGAEGDDPRLQKTHSKRKENMLMNCEDFAGIISLRLLSWNDKIFCSDFCSEFVQKRLLQASIELASLRQLWQIQKKYRVNP